MAAAALTAEGVFAETALAASPEFARTEEEWARLRDNVLEYEEIEDLIAEYNVTVQNNYEDWKRTDSGKLAKDYVEDARKAIDNLRADAANTDSEVERAAFEYQARLAESQMQSTYDSAEDSHTKKLEYDQTEKLLAAQAQSSMNSYYQLQLQLEAAQKNHQLLESLLGVAQRQQGSNVGMATYADVLTAQQNLQNADAQIISLQSQIESTRENLIVMLGWSQSSTPEIRPVPATDMNRLSAMNPETDLATALANDYKLQIDQMKLANAITESGRHTHTVNIENDKQQIAVALNSAYQSVLQAKNAYDQAGLELSIADKDYNTAQVRQSVGVGTALETLQAEAAFVTAQTNQKIADLKLFQAMEDYSWIVRGVRS